jgi:hypothetical protein
VGENLDVASINNDLTNVGDKPINAVELGSLPET